MIPQSHIIYIPCDSCQADDEKRDLLVECVDTASLMTFVESSCGAQELSVEEDCPKQRLDDFFALFLRNQSDSASQDSANIKISTNSCHADEAFFVEAKLLLSDSTFKCERLSRCHITCDGPDQEILQSAAQQCSCMLEWGFHSSVLKSILVFAVFAILNLSRYADTCDLCTMFLLVMKLIWFKWLFESDYVFVSSLQSNTGRKSLQLTIPLYLRFE